MDSELMYLIHENVNQDSGHSSSVVPSRNGDSVARFEYRDTIDLIDNELVVTPGLLFIFDKLTWQQ